MTHELPSMAEQTQENFSIRPISIGKDGAANFGDGVIGPSKADIASIEHEQKFSHEETAIVNELNSEGIVVTQRDSFLGEILTRAKENVTSALRTVNQRLGEKPVRIGAPLVLAVAALAEACSDGETNTGVRLEAITPEPTAVMETTPTPTAEPTVTITPTLEANLDVKAPPATPEAQVEVPCVVVPQELCSQAVLLETLTGTRFIGLNLPPGTPIFAPSSNELTKTEIKDGSIKGFQGSLSGGFDSDSTPPFLLYGDIKFNNMLTEDVEKGSLIGHIQDTGIENFGYNFLINLGSKGPDDKDADSRKTKFLGEMFPEAFEKPPQKVSLEVTPNSPTQLYGGPSFR